VIAATRSLPGLGWGIVVKIDQAEESQRAQRLAKMLRDLGLSIGALAILGGTLLGFQLARPIRELAHIVDIARRGDIDLRAPERGDDEVAFLARSVNELLDQTRELAERKRGK
jgi:methyl-accepting chemotaxis protein